MTKYAINWNNSPYASADSIIEIETGNSADNLKLVQHYCKLQMDSSDLLETAEIREVAPVPVIAKFVRTPDIKRVPEDTSIFQTDTTSDSDGFVVSDSTWIERVEWDKSTSVIYVTFKNDSCVSYKSDYGTFKAFRQWVDMGGSAGRFYNQNLRKSSKRK